MTYSPNGKLRIKAGLGKNKGDCLENLGLKGPYYKFRLTVQEFMLALVAVQFKAVTYPLTMIDLVPL